MANEFALRCLSLDFTDHKSTLVQVMVWFRQATNHMTDVCRHIASLGRNEFSNRHNGNGDLT